MKRYGLIFILSIFLFSCHTGRMQRYVLRELKPAQSYMQLPSPSMPVYAKDDAWFVKKDNHLPVDIFYVYPTMLISDTAWNQAIDDSLTNGKVRRFAIRQQLSLFDGLGNLYVPKYRQATFYSFVDNSGSGQKAIALAYSDIKEAFNYFIQHYNHHRPFILVGHSQGAYLLYKLLPVVMSDPTLRPKLIAAYTVGWPLTVSYLKQHPNIKSCEDSCSVGCILSWNTQHKNTWLSLVNEKSIAVNPLSWKTTQEKVPATKHRGAVFFTDANHSDTIPHYVSAKITHKGLLKVSLPPNQKWLSSFDSGIWPKKYGKLNDRKAAKMGIYHLWDFNMFYLNIRENARCRIEYYLKTRR